MADRSEAPTSRRLDKARQDGNVARSSELNSAVSMLIGAFLLSQLGKPLVASLQKILTAALALNLNTEPSAEWLQGLLFSYLIDVGPWLGLFILGMLASGVVTTVSQTGFLWASGKLGLHLERLNPLPGFQRMFSTNGLVELGKALLKLLLVGYVAYDYLQARVQDLLTLTMMDFASAVGVWAGLAYDLIIRVASAYAVLAAADYAYQRWNWMRQLKMTKEEVKEDNKMSEGDPFIRGRIRQQQRRMARMRMMSNVKKADVVITNPTHLAVAVQYDAGTMRAPLVLAKGADRMAEQIVKTARQHSVPIVQNIPLARALYQNVSVDQEVPPALYVAMAQVMAYVYRLKGKRAPGEPRPQGSGPRISAGPAPQILTASAPQEIAGPEDNA